MVFCTTYALMLPALTMEDPSAGIKLKNAFCYEDDALSINFYVSGRAVFKDEVDIDMPLAENVVLNVDVLDDKDSAYAEYSEYAVKNVGEKDLAQVMAFELDFSYLGHALDVSNCEIIAEINAKESFFVDKIGAIPDRSVYVADTSHPMATPSDKKQLAPAKAVTAMQGTVLSIADQPVVYTTEASDVKTLTIDVKGDSLAVFTSETDNYEFKVAYYAKATKLAFQDDKPTGDNYRFHDRRDPEHMNNFDIDNSETGYVGTADKTYVSLNKVVSDTDIRAYQFARRNEYIQLYKTVTYDFASYSMIKDINKLINSAAYTASELIVGADEASLGADINDYYATLSAEQKYKYNKNIKFTTNESLATDRILHVAKDSTMILIYDQASTVLSDDVTLFDYDITSGVIYQTSSKDSGTATVVTTSKQNDSLYSFASSYRQGINSFGTWDGKSRFTFGEQSTFSDMDILADLGFGNVKINRSEGTVKPGIVSGIKVDESGEFTPIFNNAVCAPDIFSTKNDFIPSNLVTDGLSDRYKISDHGDDPTVWKDLWGGSPNITVPNNDNSHFTEDAYILSYGDKIALPFNFNSTYGGFALEVKFGEIKLPDGHNGYINLLRHSTNNTQFNLYIDTRNGNANENDLLINSIGNIGTQKVADDAVSLLSDSLLTIVYDVNGGYLRIFVDGVEVFNYKAAFSKLDFTDAELILGSWDNSREVYMELTDIRFYNHPLRATEVAQNAKNLKSYAPVVTDGLIAEFDADGYSTTNNTWKPSVGTVGDIDLSGAKYSFEKNACIVTGGDRITLPQEIATALNNKQAFTIEVEFGNIKNIPSQFVNFISNSVIERQTQFSLRSSEKENNFSAQVCLGGGNWEKLNAAAAYTKNRQHYSVENMQYSTVTITFDGTTTMLYINGQCVIDTTAVSSFELDGLVFGPDKDGVVCEYRTMRFYDRALSNLEIVQNSRHDGTYNLAYDNYNGELNTYSDGAVGKTVIGGRYIEFKQTGDTYVLSAINVSTSSSDDFNIYQDSTGFDYFTRHTIYSQDNNAKTNDYWPMDQAKSFGTDGHDFKYGDEDFKEFRRFFKGDRFSSSNEEKSALLSYNSSDHNSFFGTKYKIDFTLTADYVGPLEYIFMGDDDLWVFLDDQLVCDISGVHGAIGQVVDLWNYVDRYGREEDTDHTLYVFLLERGARASTCYMEFTLPAVSNLTPENPTGTLTLSKEVLNSETDQAFDFTLSLTDADGVALEDIVYNVINADGSYSKTNVAFKNGDIVSLAHNQTMIIEYLPIDAIYTITEKEYVGYHTSYEILGGETIDSNVATGTVGLRTNITYTNTTGSMLPSTGVIARGNIVYIIPLCIAAAYMCAMPFINRPKRREVKDN